MNELEGLTFHSAEREVERLERELDTVQCERDAALATAADLRRQLAAALSGLNTTLMDAIDARNEANAAKAECQEFRTAFGFADAAFAAESAQRERADAEVADLRRQLAEERMRANAAEFAVAQLRADAAELRRQLAEAQAELLHYKTNGVSSIAQGRQVQP